MKARYLAAFFLAMLLATSPARAHSVQQDSTEAPVKVEPIVAAQPTAETDQAFRRFLEAVSRVREVKFIGEMVIAKNDMSYTGASNEMRQRGFGESDRDIPHWPYASITKQILAVLVMQNVEKGILSLDEAASTYAPDFPWGTGDVPTLRQILQHRSGFANPDAGVAEGEWSSFYSKEDDQVGYCLGTRSAALPERYTYNNCDYIVLGAILERATGRSLEDQLEALSVASGMTDVFWVSEDNLGDVYSLRGQEREVLAGYGAAGGLAGSLISLLEFDRSLLEGWLLKPEALSEMWDADPELGYMALGQWVFEARIAGCAAPVKVVERRGHIGKYQIRNVILPETGHILIASTETPLYEFGEIWSGSGALYEMIEALRCAGEGEA